MEESLRLRRGFGNVYSGMARRALDLAVDLVKQRTSLGVSRSMAYHAGMQHAIGEMVLEIEGIDPGVGAGALPCAGPGPRPPAHRVR